MIELIRVESGVYRKGSINFGNVYSRFIQELPKNTGCVTSFLGVARLESADGKKRTKYLVMESYEKHANQRLCKISLDLKRKYGLTNVLIVHALGKFRSGEPVVMVLVAAPRRVESFKALKEAVERYKKEPALFKQEIYQVGSSAWIF